MGSVSVRLATGEALLGAFSVPVAVAGERGELRIGGTPGTVVRPLRFGERGRAVRHALTATDPLTELAGAVCTLASSTGDAAAGDVVVEVLALHLAGAGSGGPGFATVSTVLARTLGWGPEALAASDAAEADHLARLVTDSAGGDEWQRVVFDPIGAGDPAGDLAGLRDELAADLLRRGEEPPDLSLVDLVPAGGAPVDHGYAPVLDGDLDGAGHQAPPPATGRPLPRGRGIPTAAGYHHPLAGLDGRSAAGPAGTAVPGPTGGPDSAVPAEQRPPDGDLAGAGAGDGAGVAAGDRGTVAASDARGVAGGDGAAAGDAGRGRWAAPAAPPVPGGWRFALGAQSSPVTTGGRAPHQPGHGPSTGTRRDRRSSADPMPSRDAAGSPFADWLPAVGDGDWARWWVRPERARAGGEDAGRAFTPEQLADAVADELHRTADLRGIDR